MAAKIAPPQQITKILFVQIFLPHNEGANPLTTLQPSVLITGTAHLTLTPTGPRYTYEIAKLQAQGIGKYRNFLNELREPLLAHIKYLFNGVRTPEYPLGGLKNHNQELAPSSAISFRGKLPNNYLTSEDYQYDRGEELREKQTDPTNL